MGGLRSVLAGLLAPLLPLAYLYINARWGIGLVLRQWGGAGLFVLAGIAVALVMFFPWLTETPSDLRKGTDVLTDGEGPERLPGDPA